MLRLLQPQALLEPLMFVCYAFQMHEIIQHDISATHRTDMRRQG